MMEWGGVREWERERRIGFGGGSGMIGAVSAMAGDAVVALGVRLKNVLSRLVH